MATTREIWTLGEARVTIWKEVGGVKSGDALMDDRDADFLRNVSLSERLDVLYRGQPGVAFETAVVNGARTVFKMSKGHLSKAVLTAVTNKSYVYYIEVSLVNPVYDGVVLVNDLHTLQTCTVTDKGISASDDESFEEEITYNVGSAS